MQGMALGQQHFAIKLFVFVASQFELQCCCFVQPRQLQIGDMVENFWLGMACLCIGGMTQHPIAVIQKAVQLHIANGHQAVKPSVGHGFHHLGETLVTNASFQLATHLAIGRRKGLAIDQQRLSLLFHFSGALGIKAQQLGTAGNRCDKVQARLGCIFLECGFIHVIRLR